MASVIEVFLQPLLPLSPCGRCALPTMWSKEAKIFQLKNISARGWMSSYLIEKQTSVTIDFSLVTYDPPPGIDKVELKRERRKPIKSRSYDWPSSEGCGCSSSHSPVSKSFSGLLSSVSGVNWLASVSLSGRLEMLCVPCSVLFSSSHTDTQTLHSSKLERNIFI